MKAGWRLGRQGSCDWGIGMFVDEEGYTSIAVAVALLVSVSLVFVVASVEWTLSRSSDVQPVADACAMAGQNTVAAYYTTAQVIDASVLSMGIAGMTLMGVGLVMAAVPGAQGVSAKAVSMGQETLDARQRFARSAASGLQTLERALPFAIIANSASCVEANRGAMSCRVGVAIPFPLESNSDFSSLESTIEADDVADEAERLQDATKRAEEAKRRADESRDRAWRADCVDEPSCLRSRATSLANLSWAENPDAPSAEQWNFGMPIMRSRAYYAQRLAQEAPDGTDIESITDSVAREAFYEYALGEVDGAWYMEEPDGHVDLHLPHLARNSQEMRETWLYGDARWPCSDEEEGRTLHSTWECPGCMGPDAGFDSVAAVEEGAVNLCEVCRMNVVDLGSVASISTSAKNGYEHYWQIIVEEAQSYQQARNEQADAEREMQGVAEEGEHVFERALEQLAVPRPRICPPGAWGCVSLVSREGGVEVPRELTDAFLTGSDLPPGIAVSAAALAPDEATNGNDVLSHFFDGMGGGDQGWSPFGSVAGLWGRLLVSYGNRYEGMSSAIEGFFGRVDGVFGGTVGSWLKERLSQALGLLGLEPADMRMRKPVLVQTGKVLGKAGVEPKGRIRSLVQALPTDGSPAEIARALGYWVWGEDDAQQITLAELPIPGGTQSVPITVGLTDL